MTVLSIEITKIILNKTSDAFGERQRRSPLIVLHYYFNFKLILKQQIIKHLKNFIRHSLKCQTSVALGDFRTYESFNLSYY